MSKAYDLSKVRELSDDDADFIKAMVETFIEEIPMDLEQLAMAVVNDDRGLVHEYAHKIKPTVDMFGLSCLYDVLVLEAWGKSEDEMEINEHFMRVQEELQKAVDQLKEDF
ncbi:Hpt domain-containing protein [Nonlabens marinus]|uniref:HPt domain-containing protein n=1 Tax=Nonlabens marinus S1-08 TaxID=1454201 RepID=W8VRM9_9FLAO|nr:Hpt domain-containing protein [Nonlabens marinus]BAO55705.1 hypothetical protein NMS_1696 [Nonlabens marinus S1-08]